MKILKIALIIFCIFVILPQNTFALAEIIEMGTNWENTGKNEAAKGTTIDSDKVKSTSENLYNILLSIATIVAVFVGALLGIKYMTAGIDKKVEVKQSLFPYLISVVIVFGSLGIWKIVVTIMQEIK